MQEHFINANGLRFHYLDWRGEGPDLLFVHPTGFVADIWRPLAERLKTHYRVVALDTRGHGESDKPAEDYGWPSFARDLESFIAAVGLSNPIGIGHSAGATAIAVCEATRPGSFRRAVLMEPILFYGPARTRFTLESNPMAAGTMKRRANWPSKQAVLASYSSRPPFQAWDGEILRQYVEHGFAEQPDGSVQLKCPPEAEARMYLWGPYELPTAELMPRITCPVLLIRGAESTALSAEAARRTQALLPDSQLVTMPGTHFAPFEHPRRAEEEILRFLSEKS
jgi:pimeloyl-ACP methyl ester carboxylesterase